MQCMMRAKAMPIPSIDCKLVGHSTEVSLGSISTRRPARRLLNHPQPPPRVRGRSIDVHFLGTVTFGSLSHPSSHAHMRMSSSKPGGACYYPIHPRNYNLAHRSASHAVRTRPPRNTDEKASTDLDPSKYPAGSRL